MMTYEEAYEFSQHPIKASDYQYTRDFATFDYMLDEFKKFLIRELTTIIRDIEEGNIEPEAFSTRKRISNLKTMHYDLHKKCKDYAYHTGIHLIAKNKYNL